MYQGWKPNSILQEGKKKKNYEVKQKSLKGILKAKQQQAAMKKHMENLQAERKSRDANHTTALEALNLSSVSKAAKAD